MKKLNVVVEKNNKYFSNINAPVAPQVRFVCFSLCVLSVYKVSGDSMDLSIMTAKSSRQSAAAAK